MFAALTETETKAETDSCTNGIEFNDKLGIGYSGRRIRLMHISIGSVHILSVSISV